MSIETPIPDSAKILQFEPRKDLLLSAWLKRDLPPRDYLLGNVLCTTSRWLLYGETGVGKTLVAMDIGGAVGAGVPFLNWEGSGKPRRVMYLDGEMPAETFKERMEIVAGRYGPDLKLYGYNRDVLKDDDLPPLNTEEGEKWLWREIGAVKPELILFDSIMCLNAGVMAEEESWAPIKPLMRQMSSRRIGQIWLHHTGHDTTKAFGTKTREWEMDTVIGLTKGQEGDENIALEFKKARLRTPKNRDQFESRLIRCDADGWTVAGSVARAKREQSGEMGTIAGAILSAYDALAAAEPHSIGPDGGLLVKIDADRLRGEVKSRGYLDVDEKGHILTSARKMYGRAKAYLLTKGRLIEHNGEVWKPGP